MPLWQGIWRQHPYQWTSCRQLKTTLACTWCCFVFSGPGKPILRTIFIIYLNWNKDLMFWKSISWKMSYLDYVRAISLYLTRFPTISAGNTMSSNIASCKEVSVQLRGRCTAEPFFSGLTILCVAIKTTSCQEIYNIIILAPCF